MPIENAADRGINNEENSVPVTQLRVVSVAPRARVVTVACSSCALPLRAGAPTACEFNGVKAWKKIGLGIDYQKATNVREI